MNLNFCKFVVLFRYRVFCCMLFFSGSQRGSCVCRPAGRRGWKNWSSLAAECQLSLCNVQLHFYSVFIDNGHIQMECIDNKHRLTLKCTLRVQIKRVTLFTNSLITWNIFVCFFYCPFSSRKHQIGWADWASDSFSLVVTRVQLQTRVGFFLPQQQRCCCPSYSPSELQAAGFLGFDLHPGPWHRLIHPCQLSSGGGDTVHAVPQWGQCLPRWELAPMSFIVQTKRTEFHLKWTSYEPGGHIWWRWNVAKVFPIHFFNINAMF